MRYVPVSDPQCTNFDIARRESGAAEVHGPEILARVKRNGRLRWLRIEVGQQLEFHDWCANGPVCCSAPDPGVLRDETGIAQRLFEPCRVFRPTGDLKVYLHINVDRPCVLEFTSGAEQIRNQASKDDELRSFSIVVDDADKRPFRCFPCRSGAERQFIDHVSFPEDARRLPRPARRQREDRRRRGATERYAIRLSPWPAAWP